MPFLDIKTVMASYVVSNAVCAGVIFLLWRQNRRRFAGTGLWLADFVLQLLTVILVAGRNFLPAAAMIVANGAAVAGTILLYIGLERFVGKPGPQVQNVLLLTGFLAAHWYFLFPRPDLAARNILLSAALLALTGQAAWLMLRRTPRDLAPATRIAGWVFAAFALASLFRITVDLLQPGDQDFFRSGVYDTLVLMTYQTLFVSLTFALVLMVNRRLFAELETDLGTRREVEEALRISEEKFFKAFHYNPDAILITRARDGKLVEVNEGFSRLTGYTRAEALSSSSIQLALWADPADRNRIVALLRAEDRVQNLEYSFRTKTGDVLHCLYSGELIRIAGEPHIVSIVRDVTDRKQADAILNLRVNLWEYSVGHTTDELMRQALDEIENITGSSIGFYHFVLEDEQSLSLQAWSTRTLREFCRAEGRGMHSDLDRAGVWADCIRLRKPVIHNDYASLAGRKGLPPGHAAVQRELVVPTFHGGRVVSVLGVGNKRAPYSAEDAEFLGSVADVVWVIVDHKRTEEKIRALQRDLADLAVHDSLTGLYNRRYLEETLARELARAAREKYPVGFIMIDLDRFKDVNDAFGHKAGDAVLKDLSALLRRHSRAGDILFRYGGEEFLAVLPKVEADAALKVAEKWRKAFRGSVMLLEHGGVKVTLSCGIAAFPQDGRTGADLISAADKALYQSKTAGRNRSTVWRKPKAPSKRKAATRRRKT
jgi:diguanylate cyclase (GGDEF)-like protein/PAS domain S-box-containing protein